MTRPCIEVTVNSVGPDGKSKFESRRIFEVAAKQGGWASADNLGREHCVHQDEQAARQALSGWMMSRAKVVAPALAADDEDLIG